MNKITADHLARRACMCIGQSKRDQVQHNFESQRRQHVLVDRARLLGRYYVDAIDDEFGLWDPELSASTLNAFDARSAAGRLAPSSALKCRIRNANPSRHMIPTGSRGAATPNTGSVDLGVSQIDSEGGRP